MVVWIIGLAGAGKSSIGQAVYQQLRAQDPATVLLDGDHFRQVMGGDLGHSLGEREENGWRMCRLSQWLDSQGVNVVACVLSNFPEQQAWNRKHLDRYFEVYVDVPMEVLEARDQKRLYSGARTGAVRNVVGVDLPFNTPASPDMVVRNDGPRENITQIAREIVSAISERWPAEGDKG
ncbi:MAG: adenylyl-sulfate kinase [Gammaproteobacteria bacterium]|nr:adenylyl-sulfate kinase [Gammaproteobacteria bacterium]